MNDLYIAAIPFTAFVVFFLVWLSQMKKEKTARVAVQKANAQRWISTDTTQEADRSTVQISA